MGKCYAFGAWDLSKHMVIPSRVWGGLLCGYVKVVKE